MPRVRYVADEEGLRADKVGEWGEQKYDFLRYYAQMFSNSMRGKWDSLAYIDLFSGPGRAQLEDGRFVDTSPTIALGLPRPFDLYVFCDLDEANVEVLRTRWERSYSDRDARFLNGDSNMLVADVLRQLPTPSRGHTLLGLCVLDPYNLNSLKFTTVEKLAQYYMDFLVLIATDMDANRHWAIYERPANRVVADFTGQEGWRQEWAQYEARVGNRAFARFVRKQFVRSMEALNLRPGGACLIRRGANNMVLYELVLFSRSKLGREFSKIAQRRTDPLRKLGQGNLFEDET
jgi:three-Cys-motif partner protein